MTKITKEMALDYHKIGKPGKVETVPTKPYSSQSDLSLAYSPGVAYPCLEIQENPQDAYEYTSKGNLVAVISNGTAVLGLGDIGALAGKPVMEGKALLFKIFGGLDCFDIEIDEKDPEKFIHHKFLYQFRRTLIFRSGDYRSGDFPGYFFGVAGAGQINKIDFPKFI